MKKDNVLKKEFQRKDVERLRNLVKGKHGDKTTLGIGYTKKQEHYHEGDTNFCAYIDTDSNYFNAEPLLKYLYPDFESF